MAWQLLIEEPGRVARRVELPATGLILGRAPDCGEVLSDPLVSRRHLWIGPARDGCLVRDLGGANGCRIGADLVLGEAKLPAGGAVQVGRCAIRVCRSGLWPIASAACLAVVVVAALSFIASRSGQGDPADADRASRLVVPQAEAAAAIPPPSSSSAAPAEDASRLLARAQTKLKDAGVAPSRTFEACALLAAAKQRGAGTPLEAQADQLAAQPCAELARTCARLLFAAERARLYGDDSARARAYREVLARFPDADDACAAKARQGLEAINQAAGE